MTHSKEKAVIRKTTYRDTVTTITTSEIGTTKFNIYVVASCPVC